MLYPHVRYSKYSHFTDQQVEAQKCSVTCSRCLSLANTQPWFESRCFDLSAHFTIQHLPEWELPCSCRTWSCTSLRNIARGTSIFLFSNFFHFFSPLLFLREGSQYLFLIKFRAYKLIYHSHYWLTSFVGKKRNSWEKASVLLVLPPLLLWFLLKIFLSFFF